MKIKKGDKVKVIAGKDKGKSGKVIQVFSAENKFVIEGINLRYKNLRPRKANEKGQRIEFPAPLEGSNVALVCPKCGQATRVALEVSGRGRARSKLRKCKQCQEVLA